MLDINYKVKKINIMARLIFDIETIGENFDEMDETTKLALSKWIKRESGDPDEHKRLLADLKAGMGFSPLTGQIVVIGVLDVDKDNGVIYFQAPGSDTTEFTEDNFKYKLCTEKDMLKNFWEGAKQYHEFISYNGRSFDVPFIIGRSAVNKVKITKDLMANRYGYGQKYGVSHIDLLDQLTYYGAVRKRSSLHLWCRALGIKSPKEDGINGENVAKFFKEGKYADIARYNANDLVATKKLYEIWKEYMNV